MAPDPAEDLTLLLEAAEIAGGIARRHFRGDPWVREKPGLGPVTQAGCGALCPAYGRGCYGCFGPMETPNPHALSEHFQQRMMMAPAELVRLWRTFNADAAAFREESERYEHAGNQNDHR